MNDEEFAPVTPGEMLKDEFLVECRLSQRRLAKAVGISPNRIAEIVNNRRRITAEHGAAARPLFRHLCRVLDKPSEPVRPEDGAPPFDAGRGRSNQGAT